MMNEFIPGSSAGVCELWVATGDHFLTIGVHKKNPFAILRVDFKDGYLLIVALVIKMSIRHLRSKMFLLVFLLTRDGYIHN